ncbi:DNA polymerase III, alpha subunit [Asticcacaulis biprosthecium C19]|uniref:Error-prone DNA polymerase n=1 Tax=Asticcacaulis biprosthecium C19 TaxID=715226 RepID=F4QRT6_9CAUL|nr:error-prone DNA polymerase [Asticcacaulis biprosthecium]EGF89456.1 DNA polymerase III, alpha subunit [Asticcacaulis biprosthecium C19]
MTYIELQVTTHFSFLRGASSPEELFHRAAELGIEALGVVDRNSLAGIVQAHKWAKATGVRLIVGCRLDLVDGASLLVYPTDKAAYSHLCRLLSLGKGRAGKGKCQLDWNDVEAWNAGLIAVLVPDMADDTCALNLRRLATIFGDRAYLALTLRRRPNDALRLYELTQIAVKLGVPTVATNDVLYHDASRRILQDVVTCIRHNCTIDEAGFRRERHADRYLKPGDEMARLFKAYPDAVARTQEIAARCRFDMKELEYQYPDEKSHPHLTPQQALEKFVRIGAAKRYPDGVPDKVEKQLRHELDLIAEMGYANYFLTVHDIVHFARSQDILCQGRGSAANSSVCYVLGITELDPAKYDLLFARFLSKNRNEPPDIDVDFEHARREIVMQWVFDTYGRDHAALVAVVTRYRIRGALRDVGKALGVPEDVLKVLAQQYRHWATELDETHLEGLNLNRDARRIRLTLDLTRQLVNAPRHLSQHPGGFVLTRDRLDDLAVIEPAAMKNRQVIEWDKDDIDELKFMKVDCLALGMLTCMKKSYDMLAEHKGVAMDMAGIPADDKPTYAMICKADTVGVFQIESRAQMSMLPRLRPANFYDIAIEVAIVRPGPIQGDMVHPYLRRKHGLEPIEYPNEAVRDILGRTFGVPLFQEHAMKVAVVCAGFSDDEADHVRRSLATFKHTGGVKNFRDKMYAGMIGRGYSPEFSERLINQLEGFGSYGFPESHAISFALIAYASSWMKCHHPDVFLCALLNSQPMGFYAPAQLVRDAREHGVDVRPVCVNASRYDCTLEETGTPGKLAVRLGFRMIKGMSEDEAAVLVAAREERYGSIREVWRHSGLPVSTLVRLAEADAFFPSLGQSRREALWALKGMRDTPLPLFDGPETHEPAVVLKAMTAGSEVVQDYGHVGLSLRRHPVSFLRGELSERGIVTCKAANARKDKSHALVAGMVLVRQRPGTAKGVTFMTIEDETGIANVVIWSKLYEEQRRLILTARMVAISGQIQKEGEVVHLVARRLIDLSEQLDSVSERDDAFPMPYSRGDEFRHGEPGMDPRVLKRTGSRAAQSPVILVKSRDFH